MSAFSEYYDTMRKIDSNGYPVWPPGIQVAPGDFGTFARQRGGGWWRYVFVREGNLKEYLDAGALEAETVPSPLVYQKMNGVSFKASGTVETNPSLPLKASGTISAARGVSVAIDYEPGVTHQLKDMRKAGQAFGTLAMSHEKRVMIASVTTVKSGVAILSESDGWSVDAQGDAEALTNLKLGSASVSISGEGADTDVFRLRGETPVTMRIIGRNYFGGIGLQGHDGDADDDVSVLHPEMLP